MRFGCLAARDRFGTWSLPSLGSCMSRIEGGLWDSWCFGLLRSDKSFGQGMILYGLELPPLIDGK